MGRLWWKGSMKLWLTSLYLLWYRPGHVIATERPIWGIMTEPHSTTTDKGYSFINAQYVQWLSAAGARVIPILYDSSEEVLNATFHSINGILFPGGNDIIDHTEYYNASLYLFELAMASNKRGNYFPLHGTCLGFELLALIIDAGNFSLFSHVDAENISLPLNFKSTESQLYSFLSDDQKDYLASKPSTENFHHYGINYKEGWQKNHKLTSFYNLISTSKDRNGVEFASTFEAKDYPFYAVQWHPERSVYEWKPYEDIDHSLDMIKISELVADFLVEESKKSEHSYPSPQAENDALVYNYPLVYVGRNGSAETRFIFPKFKDGLL